MKPQHDPLARRSADDSPLFSLPREVTPAKRQAHRPMAETSLQADRHVDRATDYVSILRWLNARRVDGGTHGEWCNEFERDSSTSGRFTELSTGELIAGIPGDTRRAAARRAGQVYRITVRGTDALRAGSSAVMNAVRAAKRRKAS